MEFLEVLTEGLERVLMVRGGGREVITIYSWRFQLAIVLLFFNVISKLKNSNSIFPRKPKKKNKNKNKNQESNRKQILTSVMVLCHFYNLKLSSFYLEPKPVCSKLTSLLPPHPLLIIFQKTFSLYPNN